MEILPIGSVKWPPTIVFSTVNLLLGLDLKFLLLWLLLSILGGRQSCFLKLGLTHPGNKLENSGLVLGHVPMFSASSTSKVADLSDRVKSKPSPVSGGR